MVDMIIEGTMLVSEMIYEYLKRDIITEEIQSDKLKDADIAKRNKISRTPVREALLRLTGEKLLSYSPHHGFKVRHITQKELIDTIEAILAMEVMATRKMESSAFEGLERTFANYEISMKKEVSFKTVEAYHAFHFAIIDLADNQCLRTIYSQYYLLLSRTVFLYHSSEVLRSEIIRDHTEFIDAVFKKKQSKAECAIKEHFQNLKKFALKCS